MTRSAWRVKTAADKAEDRAVHDLLGRVDDAVAELLAARTMAEARPLIDQVEAMAANVALVLDIDADPTMPADERQAAVRALIAHT